MACANRCVRMSIFYSTNIDDGAVCLDIENNAEHLFKLIKLTRTYLLDKYLDRMWRNSNLNDFWL